MKKPVFIFCFVLPLLFPHFVYAQESSCPKITVGVRVEEVYDEVFEQLNLGYPEKSKSDWLKYIESELMNSLINNSPEINFVPLSANPAIDHDYLFKTHIGLSGGGDDIEVLPEQTIIDGDKIYVVPPVYKSEYTNYMIISSLIANSNCIPNRRYILKIEITSGKDINQAIADNVGKYWRMVNIIEDRESERPVPPRVPAVETELEKEYISPLSEDTRKMKIYENVKSCNGKPAYYKSYHSQPVRFPDKTERGKIEPGENCKLEFSNGVIQYILVNEEGNAVGEYTLEKGIDPVKEKFFLSTCPLGNKPSIEKEIELIIRGLEMTVTPEKKRIRKGEEIEIAIDLHEIDPDGKKYPAADQEIHLEVSGLNDGIMNPEEKVMTDDNGLAIITYRAGQKDEDIEIDATFTPPDYPDKVEGKAEITISNKIIISVRETESGSLKEGDPYPYSYTVSMEFTGENISHSNTDYNYIGWIGSDLPQQLRGMSAGKDVKLIAELEPDEKSMKVEDWQCSDPFNSEPPLPLLGLEPPFYDVSLHASVKIWEIGKKIYITHGFLDGIRGYFPSWEDPRQPDNDEPFGVRIDGTTGRMGDYIEVPYEKFIKGESITLNPRDVTDHSRDDVWQWQTTWTIVINPY
ncbi:MAG: hypothetical protein JW965_04305 [Bacteroidales bacterium]|nr:hypothetical protein [Bacteroidales bacterium]